MKRWIGGTVFSVTVILSILFGFFPLVCIFFMIAGLFELYKMSNLKNSGYLWFYLILYVIGVICLAGINRISPLYLLILVGGIMLNDSFAYFTGRAFGKTKFSSTSPNKTVEGLIGGILIATVLMMVLVNFLLPLIINYFPQYNVYIDLRLLFVFLVIAFIFAVLGDLFESKLKRITGVKDSGTIIYGHGGILDRIDSWVLASIPVFIMLFIFV
jgi:phosphatidate cytidylyltransferase